MCFLSFKNVFQNIRKRFFCLFLFLLKSTAKVQTDPDEDLENDVVSLFSLQYFDLTVVGICGGRVNDRGGDEL